MFCHHLSRTEIHITKQPSGASPNGRKYKYSSMETNPTATVRALTLQGGETALCGAFLFDAACSDLRGMSPSCCGSSPYPCRSLAYRNYFVDKNIILKCRDFVKDDTKGAVSSFHPLNLIFNHAIQILFIVFLRFLIFFRLKMLNSCIENGHDFLIVTQRQMIFPGTFFKPCTVRRFKFYTCRFKDIEQL